MNKQFLLTFVAAAVIVVGSAQAQLVPPPPTSISFPMVVSAGAKPCLPNASGYVTIKTDGEAENLSLFVSGLPPQYRLRLFCDPGSQCTLRVVLVPGRC